MSANSLKQAVASATSSVITLGAAVSGFNAFTAVDDGVQQLYWVFEGDDFQICSGVYTHSGTTLAITHILQKSVSGAVSELPVTGLTLTSAAIVLIGGNGFTQAQHYQEGVFSTNYFTGHNYAGQASGAKTGGQFTSSVGALTAVSTYFANPVKISTIGCWVSTASAGGNFRIGIYHMDANGDVGDLIYGSGNLSTAATGLVSETLTTSIILPAGWYFSVFTADNTTAQVYGMNPNNGAVVGILASAIGVAIATTPQFGESVQKLLGSYAALPTTFTPTSVTTSVCGVGFYQ